MGVFIHILLRAVCGGGVFYHNEEAQVNIIYAFFDAVFSLGWWLIILMVGIPGIIGLIYLFIWIDDRRHGREKDEPYPFNTNKGLFP